MTISFKYFDEITFGDKNLMKEFIEIFEEQIPEFVNDFKEALANQDYIKIAAVAHKAKSTISVFGMQKWEEQLKDIQTKIHQNIIPENIDLLFLQFEKDAYETLQIFKKYVAKMD